MAVIRFEDLEVWQEAASLAVEVYTVSKNGDFNQDFGFRDQLRSGQHCRREGTRDDPGIYPVSVHSQGIFGRA